MGDTEITWPKLNCQCFDDERRCICPPAERALRAHSAYKRDPELPAMTEVQRAWCLDEIGSVEGYRAADHETDSDSGLASTTLRAWVDYCRDKGLMS